MFNIDRNKLLPMMQQYYDIKIKYPQCLLFYRLGDFYEMFFDDAIEASGFLGLALTGRNCGLEEKAPMCGVPYHSAETYIDRLVDGGYKVAICEQLEEAGAGIKLVERDVIRVITAGTVTSENLLDNKANSFLVSVYTLGNSSAIAACDITTGELFCTETNEILTEISRYNPREIVISENYPNKAKFIERVRNNFDAVVSEVPEKYFDNFTCKMLLKEQFGSKYEGFGQGVTNVIGGLIRYISDTQKTSLPHINNVNYYNSSQFMQIDYASRRNLELTESMRDGKKKGTLLWVIDKTVTSMGGRLLRSWLDKPLIDIKKIQDRQNAVEEFYENLILTDDFRETLKSVGDLERINSKIVTKRANAKDVLGLANSIEGLPQMKNILQPLGASILKNITSEFDDLSDIYSFIVNSIEEDVPVVLKEGGIFKEGYDAQLDNYRRAMDDSSSWLIEIEKRERERTGINKLKVAYNRVAGFYIEVPKSFADKVPEDYTRKATLANAERYITGELKEIENSVLGAKDRRCQLEYELFIEFLEKLATKQDRILKMASDIAVLDCLADLAKCAYENNYSQPFMSDSNLIDIKNGRHAVVEQFAENGAFVANDTYLDGNERLAIITGPNMAGKSTYMRQVALIIILAQIGSFVPAEYAEIGIIDKIFTRVGASDDLASGRSTFMVEMTELANILENATDKSFVILDEIGRGTSTYDGLAIAQAVTEYIASDIKAKTIFATHYHELTVLEGVLDGVRNYCVSAEKKNGEIIFLRKVVHGGADESFGIEVARMAGVSKNIIDRASEIVFELENAKSKEFTYNVVENA